MVVRVGDYTLFSKEGSSASSPRKVFLPFRSVPTLRLEIDDFALLFSDFPFVHDSQKRAPPLVSMPINDSLICERR